MVKALILDFDGVLTTNQVFVGADGAELVICSKYDSYGIALLREAKIPVLVLSMEKSPVVAFRCIKLGVPYIKGVLDKLTVLRDWLNNAGISASDVVYVGNDLNDRECLEMAGCAVVIQDSHPLLHIEGGFDIVTRNNGGEGAVREVCDAILDGTIDNILYANKTSNLFEDLE